MSNWRNYLGLSLWLAAYLVIGINYPWLTVAGLFLALGYWVMNPLQPHGPAP